MYIKGLSAASLLREQLARGRLAVCQLLWLFLQRPTCSFSICGSSTVLLRWTRVSAARSEENPQTRNEIFICMKMDEKLKAAGERGAADQRSTTSSGNRCSGDLTFADSSGPRHDLSLWSQSSRIKMVWPHVKNKHSCTCLPVHPAAWLWLQSADWQPR